MSDANLTQLFYLLRRDLRKIGLQDFFTTLPREGVRINDNIFIDTLAIPDTVKEMSPVYRKKTLRLMMLVSFIIMIFLSFFYLR